MAAIPKKVATLEAFVPLIVHYNGEMKQVRLLDVSFFFNFKFEKFDKNKTCKLKKNPLQKGIEDALQQLVKIYLEN